MALTHSQPGEIVPLSLGAALSTSKTSTLAKSDQLELIRLVLPEGKEIPTHKAPGAITVQCLEGQVAFTAMGKTNQLAAGQLIYLAPGEPHALKALQASSVLVTIIFQPK